MNAVERLKELDSKHGSGWAFADNTDDKTMGGEVAFLNAWLGLRHEILAVLECACHLFDARHGEENWTELGNALDAFNVKAKEIL